MAGGAQAVGKADWAPLRGRLVAAWPDNDAPGIGPRLRWEGRQRRRGCPHGAGTGTARLA
jgi:hypothetical protein